MMELITQNETLLVFDLGDLTARIRQLPRSGRWSLIIVDYEEKPILLHQQGFKQAQSAMRWLRAWVRNRRK